MATTDTYSDGSNNPDGGTSPFLPTDKSAASLLGNAPQAKSISITCCNRNWLHIPLQIGVKRRNLLAYLFAVYTSITLFVYINAVAPYVLTNYLGIPQDSQGTPLLFIALEFSKKKKSATRHKPLLKALLQVHIQVTLLCLMKYRY